MPARCDENNKLGLIARGNLSCHDGMDMMKQAPTGMVVVPDSTDNASKEPDVFGEDSRNYLEVEEIIMTKTRTKLYSIFISSPARIKTESGRIIAGLVTPSKRKLSPESLQNTPSPKQNRIGNDIFSSPSLRQKVDTMGGPKYPPDARKKQKAARKRAASCGTHLEHGQKLLTDMIRPRKDSSQKGY